MKKQMITVSLSLLIILACVLAACAADPLTPSTQPSSPGTTAPTVNTDYQAKIQELEKKITELQNSQNLSDTEYQKELEDLNAQLEALRAEAESQRPNDTEAPETETQAPAKSQFLYTLSDGKATITGYTGATTQLAIPSAIDGYSVCAIADNAFSSETLKSITVPSSVTRIGWFAFYACPKLESITVPPSVTSIGYSAFPDVSKSFTLYCHSDSFAHSYAKSYGLNYAVI